MGVMTSKGTARRTIRIPDEEWQPAGESAAAIDSDISAEIRATVHQLATRRIKEIRMLSTATACTWETPCATCAETNASRGISEASVVHNPWLIVPARDLLQGDALRDFGDGEHVLGEVVEVSAAGAKVHWADGEDVTYPTTGRAVKLVRALRDGELTFQQAMASC